MADITTGVLQWFAKEYFSEGSFSGGDLLSLAVLVLLAFALWIRRPQSNIQAILALKGEVKKIDGHLNALVAGPNAIRAKDILELKGEISQIKGAVTTLVTVVVPQGNVRSPLPRDDNMPPSK